MRKLCKTIICVCFALLFSENTLYSSDTLRISIKSPYVKSLDLQYNLGNVLKTHDFVKGDNPDNEPYGNFQSFSAKYSIHTDGRKLWQQLYGYPSWGFGLNLAFFSDEKELGMPISIFTFFDAPIKRWKRFSLNYEVQFGVAFNWKHHIPLENSYRYPIGSYSTVYFSAGLNAGYNVSKHVNLSAGLSFTHYSNGSLKLPNYGLNLYSGGVGMQYVFKERPNFINMEKPKYKKEWEWLVLIAPSGRQIAFEYHDPDSNYVAEVFNYKILTLSTGINLQFTHVLKLGAGFDFTYNESFAADTVMIESVPRKASFRESDKLLIGVYPSVEILINRISIILQPGFYIYRKENASETSPTTYQRIGIKYHFGDHFFAGINVRAYNFTKADFIEANLGFRIKWSRL